MNPIIEDILLVTFGTIFGYLMTIYWQWAIKNMRKRTER